MASRRVATDPHVRFQLFALLLKKERRLVATICVSMVIAISIWLRVISPSSQIWSDDEIRNMDGLPLSPRGVSAQVTEAKDQDREAFLKLQDDLSKQPPPDLLDGKPAKDGG